MEKVLIFGSNGLLGQSLVRKFSQDYEVYGSSFEVDNYNKLLESRYFKADLIDRPAVKSVIYKINPDIIINAAAYTDVDGCEDNNELCWNINVKGVENILEGAMPFNPVIVQISTDYVFDGEDGKYREKDEPNPRGNYARSKLASENVVKASGFENIVIRTQVLYGDGVNVRPNFVTWVIRQLKEGQQIRVVSDQVGNPTLNHDVSEGILRLLRKKEFGLYHLSGQEIISRYDFAQSIAHVFELDTKLIIKAATAELRQKAPRPRNSSFTLDKIINRTDWEPHNVVDGLTILKREMENEN